MSSEAIEQIEFVGGPLDGFRGTFAAGRRPFVAIKAPTVVRREGKLLVFLRILLFNERLNTDVVAIYELQLGKMGNRYTYIRSYKKSQLDLESEFVDTSVMNKNVGCQAASIRLSAF